MPTTMEKRLERNFVKWCKDQDIEAIKGPTATSKGFPDRYLQLPRNGGTIYVEFKGTGNYSLTPLQVWWRDYIKASNPNRYFLVETDEQLERLKEICEAFMQLGNAVVAYENTLLKRYFNKD